jgi:3-hydroxy-9,10-secoandrosta-1,3,5(10)-triene-9,17-dione monooxygenase reductase component
VSGQNGVVTIHSRHPFLPPEDDRSGVRRLRGRIAAPVTLWMARTESGVAGLTVSSMLVADGEPGRLLGLLDPESDIYAALMVSRVTAVSVLGWQHSALADAFAGVAPAPGGAFRMGDWRETDWGPVLSDTVGWAGCRLTEAEPRAVGWGMLVEMVAERVEVGEDTGSAMAYRRGRYVRL